jgi:hypothetical protein
LVGCTKTADKYLGKWQDPAKPKSGVIEIAMNGDNYLMKLTVNGFGGVPRTTTVPAVAKDGSLQINGGTGLTGLSLTYIKNSDSLLMSGGMGGNGELKRVR